MLRRAGLPLVLSLLGLASAVLVARLPPDFERTVVTRYHHGSDPLLTAALLRFGVESLRHQPSRYFQPPILHPDPNPLRGTEPLIAEALLAVPFRLALGDRPAPVYTTVRILTLALLVLATGLMLRELGARDSLSLAGGALAVLVGTTAVFVDRLQAVSLQWLPLAILLAVRFWRTGRRLLLVPFALCVFLSVQASLYTTVMLLGAAPFLVPLAWGLRGERSAGRRAAGLAAGAAAAVLMCLLVLWPYLRDRSDVAAYATPAFAEEKSWGPSFAIDLMLSPLEFGPEGWPLRPRADWDGVFPGHAFLLLLLAVAALAWLDRRASPPGAAGGTRAFRASKRVLPVLLAGLAATVAAEAWRGGTSATRLAADILLWCALVTWSLRLALWPTGGGKDETLARAASAAGLAAFVFFLLSLGSPVRLVHTEMPVLEGVFGPLSTVLPPLREMRELRRFMLPAGWTAVVGATIALERRLGRRPRVLGVVLASAVVAIGLGERARADVRKAFAPPAPVAYEMLRESEGSGGLLELPVDRWGRITSVHRMLWQPVHGRPIVAGRTGLDPSWYHPAREVFNEFPSEECLLLMRTWGIDTVLERWEAEPPAGRWPGTVVLLGERREPEPVAGWRLFDVRPAADAPEIGPEPDPGPGTWVRPLSPTADVSPATLATDGSVDTAGEVVDPEGVSLVVPEDGVLTAVELDYGRGRFARVPPELRVLGLVGVDWVEMANDPSRLHLRARAAQMLLREHSARLVLTLRPGRARRLRLVSPTVPWDLPEVRVRVAPPSPAGVTAGP